MVFNSWLYWNIFWCILHPFYSQQSTSNNCWHCNFICGFSFEKKYLQKLKSIAKEVKFVNEVDFRKRNELIDEADALIIRYTTKIDKDTIDFCPNLKYIGASSVSVSKIDTEYAKQKDICVTNIAGYCNNSIAEFVFGAIISNIRNFEIARNNVKKDDLKVKNEYTGIELQGRILGIIGLGNIGKRVADIALGLGVKVQYFSKNRKKDYEKKGVKYTSLVNLLETSDFIGLFLEYNAETENLINKKNILKIKKGSTIISITNTEIFDFEFFTDVLAKQNLNFIQTYFDTLPDKHKKLMLKNDNIITYPSIAIATEETKENQQRMVVNNLERFLK